MHLAHQARREGQPFNLRLEPRVDASAIAPRINPEPPVDGKSNGIQAVEAESGAFAMKCGRWNSVLGSQQASLCRPARDGRVPRQPFGALLDTHQDAAHHREVSELKE